MVMKEQWECSLFCNESLPSRGASSDNYSRLSKG